MFSFKLAQEFKKRVATPFPRGVVATAASSLLGANAPPFGTYISLGAIALGGALMIANHAHERRSIPVAVAAPAPASIEAVALDPPKPDPIAAVVKTAPAPEKSTARIDTTPIGAIAEPPKPKPRHRHRPKKIKALDNDP